ncbi:hypothetical protein A2960_06570 [Candidatus Gottesmanbacteria bacterium RIFCSPLOWO2_01_FULL_39_12b]|uniref:Peptidase S1 domain-containing protein n=1 Tax=Candidatus Gottesmanbacteria bacterium RIFCSPLOWO2_01_FULL_39_12b TaxID=1798388 RepID=A0A1F6ARW4_9BACT|nr:MAG: hypothetical protein A2960_06570 [Candidatus Gottesmanbacteria bacterium RIFCSPLOWO2_01_FULL_39_12b]
MAILYFKARFQTDVLNVPSTPLYKHNLYDVRHCAGTLIGSRWVLTAGHCVYLHNKEVIGVALGFYDLKDPLDTKTRLTRDVKRIILHPDFKMLPSYHPLNDLALLELSEAVTNIPTLSLIDTNNIDGYNATVIGWGEMEYGDRSSILQEVTIPVIANATSNKADWYSNQILDTMLTAGVEQGGKGVCWGDSGGPLLIWSNSKWKQAGIVSWSKKSPELKCETPKKPGVYTRVNSFASWIKSVTGINTNSGTFTGLNPSTSHP